MPRFEKDPNENAMITFNNGRQRLQGPVLSVDASIDAALIRHRQGSPDIKAEVHLPGTYIPYELRYVTDRKANSLPAKLRHVRRATFNFLEGRKTFWSRMYHHAVYVCTFCISFSFLKIVSSCCKRTSLVRQIANAGGT